MRKWRLLFRVYVVCLEYGVGSPQLRLISVQLSLSWSYSWALQKKVSVYSSTGMSFLLGLANNLTGTEIIIKTFGSFLTGAAATYIWLIFTRSSPPLEICRWPPQIVFILPTCVRPINVGFSNRFFCLSDKRFLNINIKIFFEEDKSKGAFFSAENCVFGGVWKL